MQSYFGGRAECHIRNWEVPVCPVDFMSYAVQGRKRDAILLVEQLKERAEHYVSPYFIARIYTGLGERQQAFTWLETAFRERGESLTWLRVDPTMESLHSDPRFRDLLVRLGLGS